MSRQNPSLLAIVVAAAALTACSVRNYPEAEMRRVVQPCPEGTTFATGKLEPVEEGKYAEWCEARNGEGFADRQGPYMEFFPGGTQRLAATFLNGQLHGEVLQWWKNGQPRLAATFWNGQANGLWTTYDDRGVQVEHVRFVDGRPEKTLAREDNARTAETILGVTAGIVSGVLRGGEKVAVPCLRPPECEVGKPCGCACIAKEKRCHVE